MSLCIRSLHPFQHVEWALFFDLNQLFSIDPLKSGMKKPYDHKVDVYSFAMVLWELLTNSTPFKGRSNVMVAYAAAAVLPFSSLTHYSYFYHIIAFSWCCTSKTCSWSWAFYGITQDFHFLFKLVTSFQNLRPSTESIPKDIIPLINSCWAEEPAERPEFKQINTCITNILSSLCSVQKTLSNHFETENLKPKMSEDPLVVAVDNYLLENSKKSGKKSCSFLRCFQW